jgi:hypothetical protein
LSAKLAWLYLLYLFGMRFSASRVVLATAVVVRYSSILCVRPRFSYARTTQTKKKNPSHGNEAECKQESRWDLSLKHKGNEADVYLLGCCCYLETSVCVRDCFIMKSRKQRGSHFNAALHRHIFCGYA